jgi:hypothetical protein
MTCFGYSVSVRGCEMLKDLGRPDWLRWLQIPETRIPVALILRTGARVPLLALPAVRLG